MGIAIGGGNNIIGGSLADRERADGQGNDLSGNRFSGIQSRVFTQNIPTIATSHIGDIVGLMPAAHIPWAIRIRDRYLDKSRTHHRKPGSGKEQHREHQPPRRNPIYGNTLTAIRSWEI